MASVPRLRLFAGPNGSGKSVLKGYLAPALLGVYLNADDLEVTLRDSGVLNLQAMGMQVSAVEVHAFFSSSKQLQSSIRETTQFPKLQDGVLDFSGCVIDSYLAAVTIDFLRHKLLEQRKSFTFESVMSHPSKVEFLEAARKAGYRTYLYFVATDDPETNVSRVQSRVALGGHSVPEDKIRSRYYRSLDLLMDAIRVVNRAYIFDNSREEKEGSHTWLAEITDGRILELKTDEVPDWFKVAVLDKVG